MAVRNTESRIPGGFNSTDANKLGQAVVDGNYALISYLESPLRYSTIKNKIKHIKNTYVVFIDANSNINPESYKWKVDFYKEDDNDPVYTLNITEIEWNNGGAVFNLDTEESELKEELKIKFDGSSLVKIIISVEVINTDNTTKIIPLEQDVIELNKDIEDIIKSASENNEMKAIAGDPELTRYFANDFRNYILNINESVDISANFIASILYLSLMSSTLSNQYCGNNKNWLDYINSDSFDNIDSLICTKMGITNLKPHIAYHFIKGAGDDFWNTFEDIAIYERRFLNNHYKNILITDKIDLFNQIRFPKSCLAITLALCTKLKARNQVWNELQIDMNSHFNNRDCITSIVTELETIPQYNIEETTIFSESVYDIMYSKWMQEILKTSFIQYERVKIQVLDIRSGQPIKHAHVKRIVINHGARSYGDDSIDEMNSYRIQKFGNIEKSVREWNKIESGDSPIKKAQKCLNLLGYNHGKPANSFGNEGRAQYNKFWEDRSPDTNEPIDNILEGQPEEIMLDKIIKEYNLHGATDDNGFLNVRIPTEFFNGNQVDIEIGFWDFPIVCEKLKDDKRDNSIFHSNLDPASTDKSTNFKIEWCEDENKQDTSWDNNVNNYDDKFNDPYFGWQVSDNNNNKTVLKYALRLKLKTNNGSFNGIDENLLSDFYDMDVNPIHFVIFGMQWCQPVWDGIVDPEPSAQTEKINYTSYVFKNGNHKIQNMHLVTMWEPFTNGSERYGGKGYGYYEFPGPNLKWRGGDGHQGLDIFALNKKGVIFAIHGGLIRNRNWSPNGTHKVIQHYWPEFIAKDKKTEYLHLDQHKISEANSKSIHILAGRIVAISGRTGNIQDEPIYPSHLHLNVLKDNALYNYADNDNKVCLPCNEKTPLVFPCICEVLDQSTNPKDCNFNKIVFINDCWAVAELKCPYMHEKNITNVMRIQAQLRYLNEKVNTDYLHPGILNGDAGGIEGNLDLTVSFPVNDWKKDNIVEKDKNRTDSFKDNGSPKYRRVKKGSKVGWILFSDLEHQSSTGNYKLKKDIIQLLGDIVPGGQVNLNEGDIVYKDKLSDDDGVSWIDDGTPKYRRVRYNSIVGWLPINDLEEVAGTDTFKLLNSVSALLPGGAKKKVYTTTSHTRLAIYKFREITLKPDGSGSNFLKTGNENNWENYQILETEDGLLNRLNANDMAQISIPNS